MGLLKITTGLDPSDQYEGKTEEESARLTSMKLQMALQALGFDCERAVRYLDEIYEEKAWRYVNAAGWNELLAREQLVPEKIEVWRAGLAALKAEGRLGNVPATEAERIIASHKEAGAMGGRGNKAPDNVRGFYGNQATYTLARLKRDHPALADRVVAGELSANAAAIAAGFRKRTVALPLDVAGAIRVLRKNFSKAELGEIWEDIGRG